MGQPEIPEVRQRLHHDRSQSLDFENQSTTSTSHQPTPEEDGRESQVFGFTLEGAGGTGFLGLSRNQTSQEAQEEAQNCPEEFGYTFSWFVAHRCYCRILQSP